MVSIGGEPLLWHIMRVFANHGHCDFIICTGYKKELIENYFEDSFWAKKGAELSARFPPTAVPEPDWNVTVLDTGLSTQTGGRIKQVEDYVGGDRFFASYGDSLANVDVAGLLQSHTQRGLTATVTLAHPTSRFGVAELDSSGLVRGFREKPVLEEFVSIGFFVFEPDVFSLLDQNSVLEEAPLATLAASENLGSFEHNGYWQAVDTYRELVQVQDLWQTGGASWIKNQSGYLEGF
jgi:glucose-1-phosphate cytidylyltransferase